MRERAGHGVQQRSAARSAARRCRSAPSRWRQSKNQAPSTGRRLAVVARRSGSSCPGRRRAARPSPQRRSTSPSSTTRVDRQAGRRPRPGQPGGDVVEVAGVEADLVAVAVGLDAGAVELPLHRRLGRVASTASATSAAVAASIGWTGRSTSRPTARAPPGLRPGRAAAAAARSPASIAARRTTVGGHARGLGHASAITPASAPWRSSPPRSRRRSPPRAAVARPNRSASSAWPAPRPIRRRWPRQPVDGAVEVGTVRRRLVGGARRRRRCTVAQPTPMPALPRRSPVEEPHRRSTSSGPAAPAAATRAGTWRCGSSAAATAAEVATRSARSTSEGSQSSLVAPPGSTP